MPCCGPTGALQETRRTRDFSWEKNRWNGWNTYGTTMQRYGKNIDNRDFYAGFAVGVFSHMVDVFPSRILILRNLATECLLFFYLQAYQGIAPYCEGLSFWNLLEVSVCFCSINTGSTDTFPAAFLRYQASSSLAVLKADRREKRDDREGLKRLQQALKVR